MRWLVMALAVMGCGGHGKGGGDEWDVRETMFAEAACQNECVEVSLQEQCIVDIIQDLDQAREILADSEEAQCIECMQVKTELIPQFVANQCETTANLDAQIAAACGDNDEACAGFP